MSTRATGSRRLMLMLTLLAAAMGAGAAWAQALLIVDVRVEGAGWVSADVVLDEVKDILQPGTELTDEKIQQAEDAVMKLGYYDRVTTAKRVVPGGVQVIIGVVERPRIEKILFVGNTVLSDERLASVIKSRVGSPVSRRVAEGDAGRIQSEYTRAGYSASLLAPEVDSFGVLTFVIEEVRIEDFTVTGLHRTKEFVVRRQVNLKPGELFQEGRILENRRRIYDLGIFKSVVADPLPGKVDPVKGVIVNFKIEEDRTGRATFALAYSSLDDLVMMLSVQETNFRGEAEKATVNVELFGRTSYDLSYSDPFLDDKGTALELSLFDTERRRRFVGGSALTSPDDYFEERRSGGTVRVSRPLDEDRRRYASLRLRTESVSSSSFQGVRTLTGPYGGTVGTSSSDAESPTAPPGPDNPDLNPDIPEPGDVLGPLVIRAPLHPGGRLTSLTLGLTNDFRDSRLKTTSGHMSSISAEVAGSFLGGDTEFQKLWAEHRRYFPMGNSKDTIAVHVAGGTTFGDLPLFEAFSVGGAASLRGYDEDRYRGESMIMGSVEYRHQINESLGVVGFIDVGDAFGGQFPTVVPGFGVPAEDLEFNAHTGVGLGMRVDTPLGPLRLDFGWGEDGSQAHFSFGQAF